MELFVNERLRLRPIDRENAALLFPLFRADLPEICRWFPFDEDYKLEYDLTYADEKKPPFDEAFVIYYNGEPCGRVGLYDHDPEKSEIYMYYWVATPFRRKSIALRSVAAVLAHLRSLGIKRALFEVKKANADSLALLGRLPGTEIARDEDDTLVYSCPVR